MNAKPTLIAPGGSPLARNFTALVQTMTLGWVIRALYLVILTRTLGPEDYGIFVYAMAFYISVGVLTNFGQGLLFAARMNARPRTRQVLAAHSFTLTLSMLAATVAGALGFALSYYGGTRLHWIVTASVGALMGRTMVGWVRDCAVAIEDARWVPRYELGFRFLELLTGVGLIVLGFDVLALVVNHSAVWLIEAGFALRLARRRWGLNLRPGLDRRMLAAVGRASLVFLLSIAGLHLFGQAGVLALQQIQGDQAVVGQFGVAMQIILTLMILPTALASSVAPAIGRTRRSRRTGDLAELARAVRLLIAVGGIGAVLGSAYFPALVTLVFGDEYRPAAEVLSILIWALGPYSVALIACNALNALGLRGRAAVISVSMMLLHVAGTVLIAGGPFASAALSFVAASLVGSVAAVIELGPRIGISGQKWWAVPFMLVGGAGALIHILPVTHSIAAPAIAAILMVVALCTGALTIDDIRFACARFARSPCSRPARSAGCRLE